MVMCSVEIMASAATTKMVFENELEPFLARELAEDEDEGLSEQYRQLAFDLYGETDEKRKELLDKFILAVKEKGWKVPDRTAFYVKFLRAGNLTVDGAMKVLKEYILQRTDLKHYFKNAVPSQIEQVMALQCHNVLPHRDQNGRRIIFYRGGQWDPDKVKFADAYGVGCMIGELIAVEPKTQVAGVTVLVNAEGFGFKQFRNISLDDIKNGASLIQESFPLWFRAIHVVNAPRFFVMAFQLLKPFLNEMVKESIKFHSSFSELHKYVSPEIVPDTLGGTLDYHSNADCFASMAKMEDLFEEFRAVSFGDNKD